MGIELGVAQLQQAVTQKRIGPPRGTFRTYGSGWRMDWPPNARLEIYNLHESTSAGIHAEVQAFWGNVRLEWEYSLNIGSTRSRDIWGKRLQELSPTDFDWLGAIRQAAETTIEAHRQGAPVQEISYQPAKIHTDWLIKPLLAEGQTTLIYADGASGKSYLALWLAWCAAGGILTPEPLETFSKASVLYLDWETDEETHSRRLRRLALGSTVRPKILYRSMYRPLAKDMDRLRAIVSEHEINFVVVDSLGWATGGNMNEPESAIACMTAIHDLPGTKLCLTHISHAGAAAKQANIFGSRYFFNGPRLIWEMRRNENNIGLYCRKSNLGRTAAPIGLAFDETEEDGPITYYGAPIQNDAELTGSLPLVEAIEATLTREGPLQTQDLAEFLDQSPDTISRTMRRHRNHFTVYEGGQGKKGGNVWTLSD
jgi:hypothetical protein